MDYAPDFERAAYRGQSPILSVPATDPNPNLWGAVGVAACIVMVGIGIALFVQREDESASVATSSSSEVLHFARSDKPEPPQSAAVTQPKATFPQIDLGQNSSPNVHALMNIAPPATGQARDEIPAQAPAAAPIVVTLKVARDHSDAHQIEAVRQSLANAGVSATDLAIVARMPARPRIGYYFRSDRRAATNIARVLSPIIGDADLSALSIGGRIPSPGSIEISF